MSKVSEAMSYNVSFALLLIYSFTHLLIEKARAGGLVVVGLRRVVLGGRQNIRQGRRQFRRCNRCHSAASKAKAQT